MVDCATYQDQDLEERRANAKRQLYAYFQVNEGDKTFKWTFSNWEEVERRNRRELPYREMQVEQLDKWTNGWKNASQLHAWNRMCAEANPSDICISTNHLLIIASIVDGATPFDILEAA